MSTVDDRARFEGDEVEEDFELDDDDEESLDDYRELSPLDLEARDSLNLFDDDDDDDDEDEDDSEDDDSDSDDDFSADGYDNRR